MTTVDAGSHGKTNNERRGDEMTEKDDTIRGSNWLPAGDSSAGNGDGTDHDGCGASEAPERDELTREEWEQLATDPKPESDLGYRFGEWEEYSTLDGSDALMFLPGDEELLREDAFLVADEDAIKDLARWY
jgi:hypothetical protein